MRGITVQANETLITETCCVCGVLFGIPEELNRTHRENGGNFYCPNGHDQCYTDPIVKRLERELAQERQKRDQAEAKAKDAERREVAAKGQIVKLKKRAANGVCPCCHRQFSNLHRHMTTKHPDFAEPSQ